VDLQIEAMGTSTHDFDVVALMEREAMRMADRVVAPSFGIAQLVTTRYGLEPARVVEGTPIVRDLDPGLTWKPGGSTFVVVGRLSEVKGSHDMVRASVPVLRQFPGLKVRFVGADGWSISTNQSMIAYLRTLIPDDMAGRFEFVSHTDSERVAEYMGTSLAVVVPSRFESFNLAAHEARALGAPVVVPTIPAFEGEAFTDSGFLTYDGSSGDLTQLLTDIASDPRVAQDVASQRVPVLGDPLGPYSGLDTAVRHERSQGGVATAALARVEAVRFDPSRHASKASLLRRVLGKTPTRVVDALKPLVPKSVKGRIKTSVGWDALIDARYWEERWSVINAESKAGRWRLDGAPRVTVVIPCYNQGEYVHQAIISVFDQTDDGFDIVVVDDGSSDAQTIAILDEIDLDRVEIIRQSNSGLPGARNAGIRVARGEFVVTLDADDMLAPTYLESMVAALESDPDAAYAHCWAELFGDVHSIWATRPPNPFQLFMSNSVVGCVTLRKSAWEEVGGYDESMRKGNEDWDLWIRLDHAGYNGVQVREPLFRYRKHGVSMSVVTEGSYEAAIGDLPTRLPHIYNRRYLGDRKRQHYPLLSILSPLPGPSFRSAVVDDIQHIALDDSDMESVIAEVRGKYVVLWPEAATADVSLLVDLCRALEEHPDAGAAATVGENPIVVVRTWSVFDPDAPQTTMTTHLSGSADSRLAVGQFPDPRWTVPIEIDGVAVQRQPPEEVGFLPDWVPA
jgi:glycosyltransferase involved in cell wall biosynthesis